MNLETLTSLLLIKSQLISLSEEEFVSGYQTESDYQNVLEYLIYLEKDSAFLVLHSSFINKVLALISFHRGKKREESTAFLEGELLTLLNGENIYDDKKNATLQQVALLVECNRHGLPHEKMTVESLLRVIELDHIHALALFSKTEEVQDPFFPFTVFLLCNYSCFREDENLRTMTKELLTHTEKYSKVEDDFPLSFWQYQKVSSQVLKIVKK